MLVVQPSLSQISPCAKIVEVQQVTIPIGTIRMSVYALPTAERGIIESLYGFNIAGVALPVEEVARIHSIKEERVRSLEQAGLKLLRKELNLEVAVSRASVLPQLQQLRHQLASRT